MKTVQYLTAVKAKLKIQSDYELAKRLGVRQTRISNYVNGHRAFDNTMAARIAELLDVDPLKVIADVELERGTDNELWKRIARRAAAVLLPAIGTGLIAAPAPADASPARATDGDQAVCIMLNRLIAQILASLIPRLAL